MSATEHADHLEGESKYQFAEKVARAFMQTLQLSGDEIGGEDSDIDEFGSFQKFE